MTKFDLDGHNLGTVHKHKSTQFTIGYYHGHAVEFDQKRVAEFHGSSSKQIHLMRFLCSLPYSWPSHFFAHYEGLDDADYEIDAYSDGIRPSIPIESCLAQGGVDFYRVKELMDHSVMAMTEKYAHLPPNAGRVRVEVIERERDAGKIARVQG